MAERVNHGIMSATATTGWETAKVGLMGWLAAGVVGALAVAAVVALPIAAIGLFTGMGVAFGATVSTVALTGAAVVGGVMGLASPVGPVAGGVLGLFKGVGRVRSESNAYEQRQQILASGGVSQQQAIAQQAYMAGQASVVQELQRYQEMQLAQQMAAKQQEAIAAKQPVGKFTANCKTQCDTKLEAVTKGREAAQAAGASVG